MFELMILGFLKEIKGSTFDSAPPMKKSCNKREKTYSNDESGYFEGCHFLWLTALVMLQSLRKGCKDPRRKRMTKNYRGGENQAGGTRQRRRRDGSHSREDPA